MKTFQKFLALRFYESRGFFALMILTALSISACEVTSITAVDPATKTKTDGTGDSAGDDTGDGTADGTNDGGANTPDPAIMKRYKAAMYIVSNNCSRCHSGMGQLEDADWQLSDYVVPGKPTQSMVYLQLKGTEGSGKHDMPRSASALSAADLAALKDWITQMKPIGE